MVMWLTISVPTLFAQTGHTWQHKLNKNCEHIYILCFKATRNVRWKWQYSVKILFQNQPPTLWKPNQSMPLKHVHQLTLPKQILPQNIFQNQVHRNETISQLIYCFKSNHLKYFKIILSHEILVFNSPNKTLFIVKDPHFFYPHFISIFQHYIKRGEKENSAFIN